MTMTMGSALPSWLTPLAWVFLTLAVVSAAAIGVDIYGRDHRRGTVATGRIERDFDVALDEEALDEADTPRAYLELVNRALAAVRTAA